MARPPKTGLNYFPLDVDFFSDPKICTVTVEHGIKGQAATIMLLCAIYRSGYYIPWNAEQCVLILKDLPGVTIAKMQKIVGTLVECQFFDKTLFHQHQVLTSRGIQQRFITTRVMKQAREEAEARMIDAPVEVDVVRRERKKRPRKKD